MPTVLEALAAPTKVTGQLVLFCLLTSLLPLGAQALTAAGGEASGGKAVGTLWGPSGAGCPPPLTQVIGDLCREVQGGRLTLALCSDSYFSETQVGPCISL